MKFLARRVGAPSLAWLWYLLPVVFVAHAIVFWGRGILDEEGMLYIQRYLADRPLLALIFDPNDTTLYQAREISYLFDIADARILAWLVDHGTVIFIPASGALGLVAAAWIYLRGARRAFRFDALTSSLLLSVFLSCIVTQASTAVFYRSAKMVLSVALFAFFFYLASLYRQADRKRSLSFRQLGTMFLLGLVMSLTDRQGLFYLLTATLILGLLWLAARVRRDPHAATRLALTAACVCAALAAGVYSFVIAPRLIDWVGGAAVSYTNQRQSLADFNWTLVSYGFEIFRGQVRYLFGNAPFAIVAGVAFAGGAATLWRHQTRRPAKRMLHSEAVDVLIVAIVLPVALVILLAGMVLYHRPIYTIPDHTLWYYTLTIPAVLVFGLTMIVASVDLARVPPMARHAVHAVLLVIIASNVLHYAGQRRLMIDSRYFSEQYARTRQIIEYDDSARAGRHDQGQRPWMRVEPGGVVIALPIEDEAFPREVQAAYATYRHRRPLDEATGPYWSRIYEFLSTSPALFDDPEDLRQLIDGLRSVGVRRIELHPPGGGAARPSAEALRATGQTTRETALGDTIAFDLAAADPRPAVAPLRQIPAGSFRATASYNPDALRRAFDGNTGTYWSTDERQAGDEWIRIDFDRPIDVGCVRLFFNATNPGRNPVQASVAPRPGRQDIFKESYRPRGLVIDTITGAKVESATQFNPLGALIQALLRNPVQPEMEFWLAPNQSRTLVLRQTGRSESDAWKVSELTIWARK